MLEYASTVATLDRPPRPCADCQPCRLCVWHDYLDADDAFKRSQDV